MSKKLLVEKVLSDETFEIIRSTILQIKNQNNLGWKQISTEVDSATDLKNVLTNFVVRKQVPRIIHFRKYIRFVEKYFLSNQGSPIFDSYKKLNSELFGSTDPYLPFKTMLELSSNEQQKFSANSNGTFLAIRRSSSGQFVVSHVLVSNTYESRGLPICRIIRKRLDGNGDITIEGSLWKKNQHIYILGYEKSSGHIRTVQLTPTDTDINLCIGLASGHDSNGSTFSARIHIIRTVKDLPYTKCRNITGSEHEELIVRELFNDQYLPKKYLDSMKSLCHETYTSVSAE